MRINKKAIEDLHGETMDQIHALFEIIAVPPETLSEVKDLMVEYTDVYNDPDTSVLDCNSILNQLNSIIENLKAVNRISNEQLEEVIERHYINSDL